MTEPTKTPAATNMVVIALLIGAVMIAVLGTVIPGMIDLGEPASMVLRVAFYAVAAGDVAIALWFRSKLKKTRAAEQGGTVQRR